MCIILIDGILLNLNVYKIQLFSFVINEFGNAFRFSKKSDTEEFFFNKLEIKLAES